MLPRLLLCASLALAGRVVAAQYPYEYDPIDDFEAQGLEMLEGRYGQAYPGFAGVNQQLPIQYGNVGLGQQYGNIGQFGTYGNVGLGNVGLEQPLNLGQIPQVQRTMQPTNQWSGIGQNLGVTGINNNQLGLGLNQGQFGNIGMGNIGQENMQLGNIGGVGLGTVGMQQGYGQMGALAGIEEGEQGENVMTQPTFGMTQNEVMPAYGGNLGVPTLGAAGAGFGGVGAFGAGGAGGLGTSKKTTMAQPIYAQSMVVPKIITQPILRPHSVTQPILQQHLIQQPIVETRQVIQPVIRRIITQPIIRPEIYESTTIQPTLKTETTVQPRIVQQTVVTPQLQNQYEEQAPIQEKPRTQVAPTTVQPTISGKKQGGGLGGLGLF